MDDSDGCLEWMLMMKLEEVGRSHNPSLRFYAPAKFLKSHFEKVQYFAGYEQVAKKTRNAINPMPPSVWPLLLLLHSSKKFPPLFDQLPVIANFQRRFANQPRCTASVAVPHWSCAPS